MAVIGHTGSGKSTLIQHINGLMTPTSGSVMVDDIDINKDKANLIEIRKKVGIVFQYPEYQLLKKQLKKI